MTTFEDNKNFPCNIDAEQRILGKTLINNDALLNISEYLKAEHFFQPLHQKIYEAIIKIRERDLLATPITIKAMLSNEEIFKSSEGMEYLNKLVSLSVMVLNISDYGKIVYDLFIKRSLMSISETIYTNALNSSLEQDSQMQLQNAENMLYELAENGSDNKSFVDLKTSVNDSVANITKAMKNPRHITGISTGFLELDKLLCGFQDSDLVILAARPSMGKTALAINMAVNACNFLVEETKITGINKSVGFFSLEMSSQQLAMRIISMNTSINSSFLKSGGLTEEQYNKLQRESAKLSELPLFLDDTPALTINALRTRAKKLKRKNNLAILFIDYLQLIRGNSKHENRVNEVSEITQGLKLIAKELNIPVIALAQLSRAVETREDKRPMLSDLRESGSIEQDADIVMFIYRDEYYLTRKQPDGVNKTKMDEWQLKMNQSYDIAEILIAKHRNGAIGNAHIGYDNTTSKFSNKVNVVNKEFHTF